jgi:hypothetical protein
MKTYGGSNKHKGYKNRPTVPINQHALERVREHWPDVAHLYNTELQFLLSDQILDALAKDDFIIAPGGVYVPITIFGEDGYAVLINQHVVTVLPKKWCPEVDRIRAKRNGSQKQTK